MSDFNPINFTQRQIDSWDQYKPDVTREFQRFFGAFNTLKKPSTLPSNWTSGLTSNITWTWNGGPGIFPIYIPASMLISGNGNAYTVTISNGGTTVVLIPIAPNTVTIMSGNLLFWIYVTGSSIISTEWVIDGSNSNGAYQQFSDGTLIQNGNTASLTTTRTVGNVFGTTSTSVTFPISFFTNAPKVLTSTRQTSAEVFGTNYSSETITGCDVQLYGPTSSSVGFIVWEAIGRWK